MAKIIHIADLHISAGEDRIYCLQVLREIIDAANAKEADFLLISGDLFDSFRVLSYKALVLSVREEFGRLRPRCRVYFIPGNHERHGCPDIKDIAGFDLGRVELLFDGGSPFLGCYRKENGIDIVAVPYGAPYSDCQKWNVPKKENGIARILMMHGTLSSVYSGPDGEEDKPDNIPDSIFDLLSADYALLGHIHSAAQKKIGECLAVYSGSPRVWRRGETGPRRAVYIDTSKGNDSGAESVRLSSAGEYREIDLPLCFDASLREDTLDALSEIKTSENDYLYVCLSGIVADQNRLRAAEERIRSLFSGRRVRKLEINCDGVEADSSVLENELANEFLKRLDKTRPEIGSPRMTEWLETRMQGLEALREKK